MSAPEIKFCGLTREADAELAGQLGASWVGVIFAGGPRSLSAERARQVLEHAGDASPVGVFGAERPESIVERAAEAGLDVLQLHADPEPEFAREVRAAWRGPVWSVLRVAPDGWDAAARDRAARLYAESDALVVDAKVEGKLGGAGVRAPWAAMAADLLAIRREGAGTRGRLVLAGGLTAASVGEGIALLAPDVVDVSSGVESAPGTKDHDRMRAFAAAVRGG